MTDKITFRLDAGTLQALDDIRRAEKDIPTRGEMIRRLIQRAAPAETPPKPSKKVKKDG